MECCTMHLLQPWAPEICLEVCWGRCISRNLEAAGGNVGVAYPLNKTITINASPEPLHYTSKTSIVQI